MIILMCGNIIILSYKKKLLKRSATPVWPSNSFSSIKSSAAEDFTVAVGSTDRTISHVDLGLSFWFLAMLQNVFLLCYRLS